MSLVPLQNIPKNMMTILFCAEVYFTLSAGERVGLIGRNGAGKTTLLRLILRQEQPDVGAVEVEMGKRIGYFLTVLRAGRRRDRLRDPGWPVCRYSRPRDSG